MLQAKQHCVPDLPIKDQDRADMPSADANNDQQGFAYRASFTLQHFNWMKRILIWTFFIMAYFCSDNVCSVQNENIFYSLIIVNTV